MLFKRTEKINLNRASRKRKCKFEEDVRKDGKREIFFLFRDEKKSLFNCLVTWVIVRLILLLGNNEVLVVKQGLFEVLGDFNVFNLVFKLYRQVFC